MATTKVCSGILVKQKIAVFRSAANEPDREERVAHEIWSLIYTASFASFFSLHSHSILTLPPSAIYFRRRKQGVGCPVGTGSTEAATAGGERDKRVHIHLLFILLTMILTVYVHVASLVGPEPPGRRSPLGLIIQPSLFDCKQYLLLNYCCSTKIRYGTITHLAIILSSTSRTVAFLLHLGGRTCPLFYCKALCPFVFVVLIYNSITTYSTIITPDGRWKT